MRQNIKNVCEVAGLIDGRELMESVHCLVTMVARWILRSECVIADN